MSIDRDIFENTRADEYADQLVPDQVIRYLAVNDNRSFKPPERASQVGVNEGAVITGHHDEAM